MADDGTETVQCGAAPEAATTDAETKDCTSPIEFDSTTTTTTTNKDLDGGRSPGNKMIVIGDSGVLVQSLAVPHTSNSERLIEFLTLSNNSNQSEMDETLPQVIIIIFIYTLHHILLYNCLPWNSFSFSFLKIENCLAFFLSGLFSPMPYNIQCH